MGLTIVIFAVNVVPPGTNRSTLRHAISTTTISPAKNAESE
jgi:hypothetical protein